MSTARKQLELTEDEFCELVQRALRAQGEPPKPERAKPVDREPSPQAYADVMARRRRRGR